MMEVFIVEPNNKKSRVRYNVLFVPDVPAADIKKLSLRLEVVLIFFAAIAFLIVAAFAYCFILSGELNESQANVATLKTQVDTLNQEKQELLTLNDELEDKVTILSDTVNDKVQKEEAREAEIAKTFIPTGFPLKGTASYDEGQNQLEGNPIATFNATNGTSVLATAKGTVSSIAGSSEVGYIVMIDHGNGYFSIYRNNSKPKVNEGDEVDTTTELYAIDENNTTLGYQIILDNTYIEPLELMEIKG